MIILSLILEFTLDIDLSSGGSSSDFKITLPAVIDLLNFNLNNWSEYTRHFPLHYFLMSLLYRLVNDENIIRFIYILISSLIPLLIYLNLKKLFKKENTNKLFLFSSIILFLPFIRSSIIWPNAHLTGLIFFLLGHLFLQNFLNLKNNLKLILSIFFLSLSVYSVQYYAVFFGIFLYLIFKKYGFRIFAKAFFFV